MGRNRIYIVLFALVLGAAVPASPVLADPIGGVPDLVTSTPDAVDGRCEILLREPDEFEVWAGPVFWAAASFHLICRIEFESGAGAPVEHVEPAGPLVGFVSGYRTGPTAGVKVEVARATVVRYGYSGASGEMLRVCTFTDDGVTRVQHGKCRSFGPLP